MSRCFVLLSGPIAVGKTAVADALIKHHGFASIRSGNYLRAFATTQGRGYSRSELQALGDELDKKTDYAWLTADVAAAALSASPDQDRWLLDCVRKKRQIAHFRERFAATVWHVHFTASEEVLRERYETRMASGGEYTGNTPYAVAATHPNELCARSLIGLADLTINLDDVTSNQAATAISDNCDRRADL